MTTATAALLRPTEPRPAVDNGTALDGAADEAVRVVEGSAVAGRVERWDDHTYVVPVAGRLRPRVDFQPLDLAPGQVLHLHPGQLLHWGPGPRGARALLVTCPHESPTAPGGGAPEEWLPGQPPAVATFEPAAWRHIVDAVRLLRAEVVRQHHEHDPDPEAVDALRRLFLARTRRAAPAPARAVPALTPYVAFRRVMERHLGRVTQVGELARLTGYSPTTVSRACVRATGLSAKELLDERIMLEAQRLLRTTPLTVAEVAAHLGYREPTNFTRAFRRVTGQSPSAARGSARA